MALNDPAKGAILNNRLVDGDKLEGIPEVSTWAENIGKAIVVKDADELEFKPFTTADNFQYKTSVTVGTEDADYVTDGTDDNVQIQEAVTEKSTGGEITVKDGTYVYSTVQPGVSVTLYDNQKISGVGSSTVISDTLDVPLKVNFAEKGILKAVSKENIEISSLKLKGYHNLTTDDVNSSGNGVWLDTCNKIDIHDISIEDGFHAIGMHDTNKVTLNNIDVTNCEHGLYQKNSDGTLLNNYRVTKDSGFLQRGLFLHYCRNWEGNNINVYNADTSGIYIRTEGVIIAEPCYNIKLNNVTCISDESTSNDEVAIRIDADGNTISDVKVNNGYFSTVNGSGAMAMRSYTDQAGLISDVRFINSTFYSENGNGAGTTSTLGVTTKMFSNLYFENCLFHSKNRSGANFSFCDNLVFNNCHFKSEDLTGTYAGIIIRYCSNVQFIDCWFDGAAKDFSFLSDCSNIKVVNPKMTSGVWENNDLNTADIDLYDTVIGSTHIHPYSRMTYLSTTGANSTTLADSGIEGMIKRIYMKAYVDTGTLTPATKRGFTSIEFNAIGDFVELIWTDGAWQLVTYYGCTINGGTNYLSESTGLKLDQTTPQTITGGQPIQNTLTASELVSTDANKKLSSLPVATYPSLTEISYVKGLTSSAQDQINNKQATLVSGTNIKTINTQSILGSGDLTVSGGHTIEDEGTPLTQRTSLNFVGAGVTATDDSGNDATIITISGGGGGTAATTTTDTTDFNNILSSADDEVQKALDTIDNGQFPNINNTYFVRAATTANITIATALNDGDTLDGVTLATGDRVLVKNQTTASENGIYVVGVTPARWTAYDTDAEIRMSQVCIKEGTVNIGECWINTNLSEITVDTTDIEYLQTPYKIIQTSKTFTVKTSGGDFTTPYEANTYLNKFAISGNATITVEIDDGTWAMDTTFIHTHPNGDRILWTGKNTYSKTMASIQSSSGSAGAWSIIINLDSVTNIAENDYFIMRVATGGTRPETMLGCWKITNVDTGNNRITVTSTSRYASAPSGNVTGTCYIVKTILAFTGAVIGFNFNGTKIMGIDKMVLQGDGTGTFGILANTFSSVTTSQSSTAVFGVTGFGQGISASNDSYIGSRYSVVSNCTNGFLTALNSLGNFANSVSSGNAAAGFLGQRMATLDANTALTISVGNGTNGYEADLVSKLNVENSKSLYNGGKGYSADKNSSISATNTTSTTNTTNDYIANHMSSIYAVGAAGGTSCSPSANTVGNDNSYIDT